MIIQHTSRLTLLLLLAILAATLPAQAGFYDDVARQGSYDGYRATRIWWKDWTIASSEELWKSRTHHQFPLSHLFDGDAATTWADSSPRTVSEHEGAWRGRFGLNINTDTQSRIDELWIMNGYNKNQELFKRNDRIVEMEIWINGTKVKTAHLSDRMGWHKISVPPTIFVTSACFLPVFAKAMGRAMMFAFLNSSCAIKEKPLI